MADKFSKAKRSEIMSRIRSTGTSLDLAMRKALEKEELKFVAYPKLFGSPDFLVGDRVAVFCDSSFWHGKDWKKLKQKLSKGSNAEYWVAHIEKNRRRDRAVSGRLRKMGYTVVRFWDTDVYRRPEWCVGEIRKLF